MRLFKIECLEASDEMSHYAEYDYILVNDDFDKTVEEIIKY